MKKFNELSTLSASEREHEVSKYWEEIDLLNRAVEAREGKESFVFYEGPPTANGNPGLHHVLARTLKDLVCRYKTMEGYQVKRRAGWDTHGLPVEIQVEKELGLKNKHEIEEYGIAEFNQKCRESVFKFESQWRDMSERMAYGVDFDNPYITLENDYIESVWWILNKFFEEDYIYEGHKILPYCARCGTGLATHEVAQGYKEITSDTVVAKFKRTDADEYFLAWTTTPWTLPSNAALTVHPDMDYLKVNEDGTVYYVAKVLADSVLKGEYEVLEEIKGKDLEGIEYEQLLPFVKVPAGKDAFKVTLGDYVTTEDGTGIVHTAPAFGEDDYETGQKYNLAVLQPVNDDGKFTDTPWKDMFVMDADLDIIKYLHSENKLYSKQKVKHNYPHCWRCDTPLLYYARPSWYIEMTRLKDQLVANNNTVDWYPSFVGDKRFGNWLENVNDWAISRSRYWGTPLPIWRCNDCDKITSVGSVEELRNRATEEVDMEKLDLHRPFVDNIHFKCECGGEMTRVKDVIDVWFDSGAMPYAQNHYPFENKDNFDQLFPADYICEGIDQTRGWFYSLIAISTFIMGRAPYKQVLVNDLILDKDGKKMSKSRGNTLNPFDLFDEFGADVVRWYIVHVSPPWMPTRFDVDGLREIESKFFRSIRNVYNFFSLYANTDNIKEQEEFFIPYEEREEIDRWILSKYNTLLKEIEADMKIFELTRVVRNIQEFVIEDLSNWYIRRNRRRFWETELSNSKKAVYNTTYEILVGITKAIAPFVPFIAEELYQNLTGEESVHIAYYPKTNEELIDVNLEEKMDLVRDLVGLGRASREVVQIKVRQPIKEVLLDGKYENIISDLVPLIKEELNVKEVVFENDLSQFMDFELKPNFKEAGPKLGSKIGLFGKELSKLNPHEAVEVLENGGVLKMNLDGEEIEVNKDLVQINISSKEGFDVSMENNKFVILDTTLTEELLKEGYTREFISKVQQMRKSNGYDVLDNINIYYNGDTEIENAVNEYMEYIKDETLAVNIEKVSDDSFKKEDLNGHETGIKLEKLN